MYACYLYAHSRVIVALEEALERAYTVYPKWEEYHDMATQGDFCDIVLKDMHNRLILSV